MSTITHLLWGGVLPLGEAKDGGRGTVGGAAVGVPEEERLGDVGILEVTVDFLPWGRWVLV